MYAGNAPKGERAGSGRVTTVQIISMARRDPLRAAYSIPLTDLPRWQAIASRAARHAIVAWSSSPHQEGPEAERLAERADRIIELRDSIADRLRAVELFGREVGHAAS